MRPVKMESHFTIALCISVTISLSHGCDKLDVLGPVASFYLCGVSGVATISADWRWGDYIVTLVCLRGSISCVADKQVIGRWFSVKCCCL